MKFLCQPYYTSKLTVFEDLDSIETYGFRGEALYSICSVGTISVVTKTVNDDVALMYSFDSNGLIVKTTPTHHGRGTTVLVTDLFKDLPVRRQLYKNEKNLKDEVKKIEELLISYALVFNNARLTLTNNKKEIWRKNRASNLQFSIRELFKSRISQELTLLNIEDELFTIHGFVPKEDCDFQSVSRATGDRIFVSVNKRPVSIPKIKKVYLIHFVAAGILNYILVTQHRSIAQLLCSYDRKIMRLEKINLMGNYLDLDWS